MKLATNNVLCAYDRSSRCEVLAENRLLNDGLKSKPVINKGKASLGERVGFQFECIIPAIYRVPIDLAVFR